MQGAVDFPEEEDEYPLDYKMGNEPDIEMLCTGDVNIEKINDLFYDLMITSIRVKNDDEHKIEFIVPSNIVEDFEKSPLFCTDGKHLMQNVYGNGKDDCVLYYIKGIDDYCSEAVQLFVRAIQTLLPNFYRRFIKNIFAYELNAENKEFFNKKRAIGNIIAYCLGDNFVDVIGTGGRKTLILKIHDPSLLAYCKRFDGQGLLNRYSNDSFTIDITNDFQISTFVLNMMVKKGERILLNFLNNTSAL